MKSNSTVIKVSDNNSNNNDHNNDKKVNDSTKIIEITEIGKTKNEIDYSIKKSKDKSKDNITTTNSQLNNNNTNTIKLEEIDKKINQEDKDYKDDKEYEILENAAMELKKIQDNLNLTIKNNEIQHFMKIQNFRRNIFPTPRILKTMHDDDSSVKTRELANRQKNDYKDYKDNNKSNNYSKYNNGRRKTSKEQELLEGLSYDSE